jgi:TonB family protein
VQTKTPLCISALITALLVAQPPAQAQSPLTAARDLYAAAAYEDALRILDTLPPDVAPDNREAAALYRALCLFAVGRAKEGSAVIDTLIHDNPLYHPPDGEMPPRIQLAFTAARRRLLPLIAQQQYNDGKSAFDRQDFAAAAGQFKQALDTLADPDVTAEANQPPLSDLRTLALGFHTLSDKAIPPPPAPAAAPAPRRILPIYIGEEPGVVSPVVVRQDVPSYVGRVPGPRTGVVEVVVNEQGTIDAARMTISIEPRYDERVLSAARKWLYKPATVDGTPVKFLRRVRVVLAQSPPQ